MIAELAAIAAAMANQRIPHKYWQEIDKNLLQTSPQTQTHTSYIKMHSNPFCHNNALLLQTPLLCLRFTTHHLITCFEEAWIVEGTHISDQMLSLRLHTGVWFHVLHKV